MLDLIVLYLKALYFTLAALTCLDAAPGIIYQGMGGAEVCRVSEDVNAQLVAALAGTQMIRLTQAPKEFQEHLSDLPLEYRSPSTQLVYQPDQNSWTLIADRNAHKFAQMLMERAGWNPELVNDFVPRFASLVEQKRFDEVKVLLDCDKHRDDEVRIVENTYGPYGGLLNPNSRRFNISKLTEIIENERIDEQTLRDRLIELNSYRWLTPQINGNQFEELKELSRQYIIESMITGRFVTAMLLWIHCNGIDWYLPHDDQNPILRYMRSEFVNPTYTDLLTEGLLSKEECASTTDSKLAFNHIMLCQLFKFKREQKRPRIGLGFADKSAAYEYLKQAEDGDEFMEAIEEHFDDMLPNYLMD